MLIFLPLLSLLLTLAYSQAVGEGSGNPYCDPSLADMMCNTIPKFSNNSIAYNGPRGNPLLPWIIGHNDVVVLNAGSYSIGNGMRFGLQPIPAIYLIENATLIINNTGSNEVNFGADIYLCGTARLWAIESTLRINNLFSFQYFIWAADESEIMYQGLSVATIDKSVLQSNPNVGGVFGLHWMRGNSRLLIKKGKSGYGINSVRFGLDNLEAGAFDNASIIADSINLLGETYISNYGTLSISNSQYIDMFIEACPGVQINLSNLPNLCDLSLQNASYACLSPQQPNITYQLHPPATTFVVNITNSKIFSWALSTFTDSIVHLANIQKDANLFVGLNIVPVCNAGGCNNSFNILVGPNVYYGLESTRVMTLDNAYVSGYHAWVGANVSLNILSGSHVGDILPNANSLIVASNTTMNSGMVQISEGSVLVLLACVIAESVLINQDAVLIATGTRFDSQPTIFSSAFFADAIFSGGNPILLGSTPLVTFVTITSVSITNNNLVVVGQATALTTNDVPLSPFPTATIELVSSSGTIISIANITSPHPTPATLTSVSTSRFQSGTYTVQLYFSFGYATFAKSSKSITIPSTSSTSSSTSSTTSTSPTSSSSSSRTSTSASSSSSSSIPSTSTTSGPTLSPTTTSAFVTTSGALPQMGFSPIWSAMVQVLILLLARLI